MTMVTIVPWIINFGAINNFLFKWHEMLHANITRVGGKRLCFQIKHRLFDDVHKFGRQESLGPFGCAVGFAKQAFCEQPSLLVHRSMNNVFGKYMFAIFRIKIES